MVQESSFYLKSPSIQDSLVFIEEASSPEKKAKVGLLNRINCVAKRVFVNLISEERYRAFSGFLNFLLRKELDIEPALNQKRDVSKVNYLRNLCSIEVEHTRANAALLESVKAESKSMLQSLLNFRTIIHCGENETSLASNREYMEAVEELVLKVYLLWQLLLQTLREQKEVSK